MNSPAAQMRHPYEACPLCGGRDFPVIRTEPCHEHALYTPSFPATITWCECRRCGHIFTDSYFTDEAAAILFATVPEGQRIGEDMENQRVVASRLVERVTHYVPFIGSWLDVGIGNGALLFAAYEWGYTVVGADLRADNIEKLRTLGLEGHCCDITAIAQPGRYSVISMADVLEHMPYPTEALMAARRLLVPKGALFLSMPNRDSILWHAMDMQDANLYWGELEHYHNFGRVRLYALLEEFGFRPVHFNISERYRAGMEVIAIREDDPS